LFGWLSRKNIRRLSATPAVDLHWRTLPLIGEGGNLPRFQGFGSDIGPFGGSGPKERTKVRDAFSPTRPINDIRLFAGREEILQTLIRSIEDLNLHVVLYGERGIGKTSLLHVLTRLARDARYRVSYYSCGEDQNFSDTFRAIAQEIPLLYDNRFGPAADEAERGGTVADLLPSGNFTVSQLSDAFAHLANTRLLILLDEFDRSPSGAFRRNIAELIKNLSDRSVRVQLVVAGVASNLAELIEHIPSVRRNICGLRVPNMTGDEIAKMIQIGKDISGLEFLPEAVERVTLVANGSPYLASLVSQYGGFCALDDQSNDVSAAHVDQAAEQVADELRVRLSDKAISATDRALEAGWGPVLLLLSGLSMRSMGRLDASKLDNYFPTRPFTEVAEELRTRFDILVEAPVDDDKRYVFSEEAIPVYLWIKLVGSNKAVARTLTD